MKKLTFIPTLLTAAALSVTVAYAQDAEEYDAARAQAENSESVGVTTEQDTEASADAAGNDITLGGESETEAEASSTRDRSLTGQDNEEGIAEQDDESIAVGERAHESSQDVAATSESDQDMEFSAVDKDGDGLLSIEEAKQGLPERLEISDANGDGLLNRDEVESALPEVSFVGGRADEPVGVNDYRTIQEHLEMNSSSDASVSDPLEDSGAAGSSELDSDAGLDSESSADSELDRG